MSSVIFLSPFICILIAAVVAVLADRTATRELQSRLPDYTELWEDQ